MGEQQEKPPIIYPTDDPETVAAKKREMHRIFDAMNAKHAVQRAALSLESNNQHQARREARQKAAASEIQKRQEEKERKEAAEDAAVYKLHWEIARLKVFFQAFLLSIPVNIVVLFLAAILLREAAGMVILLAPVIWILVTVWWSNRYKRSIPARREKERERDRVKRVRQEEREAREAAKYNW